MADQRQEPGQPYEAFGEVMFRGQDKFKDVAPDYTEPTVGEEQARESVPIVKQTREEDIEQERAREESKPGLWEAANIASKQEWIPRLVLNGKKSHVPNPDYEMSTDGLLELSKGLPDDAMDYISKAESAEEASYLSDRYREDFDKENELGKLGYTGVGLRMGAALTDPAAWGIGAAASALVGPAGLVGTATVRLSKVARIARAGTAAAAGNLAIEAAISSQKPIYNNMNYLYAVGLGFTIGGGLAAISRNPSTQVEAEGLRRAGEGLKEASEAETRRMFTEATYTPVNRGKKDSLDYEVDKTLNETGRKIDGVTIWAREEGKDVGIIETAQTTDSLKIFNASVNAEFRGKGNGVKIYQRAIKEADSRGLTSVVSDDAVSDSASRVYEALERRGYSVSKNPEAVREAGYDELIQGKWVTPDGSPVFEISDLATSIKQIADKERTPISLDSAGAMRISREIPLREGDEGIDDFLGAINTDPNVAPRSALNKARFSSMNLGLSSKNPGVRAMFKPLAEEGVGYTDRGAAVAIGASEGQRLREQKVTTEWMRGYQPNFNKWLESQGTDGNWKPFYREEMASAFNRQVTDYVEGLTENVHPSIAKQGDVMRKIFDDYRVDLNQPMAYRQQFGRPVKGFGTLENNPNYVPHEFDLGGMRKLVKEFGSPNMEYLLTKSIMDAGEDISEEAAKKAGQAYLKTIRGLDAGMGMDTARILSSGDGEEIKAFLRNNADGDTMSEVDIEDIVDALTVRKNTEGGPKYGKSRTPLNMDTKVSLRRNPEEFPEGGNREVSIRELFNRDAHDLVVRYNRRMSGSLSMARYRIPGLSDGVTSHGEWETLKNQVRDVGSREGVDPEVTNREVAEADLMYRAIMGVPNQADLTRWGESLKFFRDWSFLRFMGQVGFAQIPEVGVAASGLGLKSMFKGVPIFRGVMRDAQDGSLSHELVDELEILTGQGGDWLRAQQLNRFNDMTGTQDTVLGGSKWKDRLEMGMKKSKNIVFAGSGMAPINTLMKRSVANGIAQKFGMAAIGKGKLISKHRLRSIGLTDRQVDGILENIRTHAKFSDGLAGKKVQKMNIHKWDLASEADFSEAMFRYSNRLVQENDIGQFRMWMSHPVARMFLQFRSFIIGAHEKQLLHNLHMRDIQSFTTFASTTFLAAIGYTAMTYARSIGMSNQQEYLRKRLATSEVAKASFERSSWAALLPTAIDTVAPGTFTYRSSGQATGAIFGNPTADTIESTHSFLDTILRGNAGDSQEDVKNILRLLPFQNLNGVTQGANLVLGELGLPEDSPRD